MKPRRNTLALALVVLASLVACDVHAHDVHETIAAAEFRPDSRTLQVILRVDPQGFEELISNASGQKMILQNPAAERVAATYLRAALQMMDGAGALREAQWVGMEVDDTWAWIYAEFDIPRSAKGMQISNRVFFDHADDQINTLNVRAGEHTTTLTFTRDEPWRPIDLPEAAEGDTTLIPEVRTIGSGPTHLILIPTHNCRWSVFDQFIQRNEDRYTMHAVTLPGMAGTVPPPKPLPADETPWIDNAVAATRQLIEDRDLDKPAILGHGLGGTVAYRLAIEHPDAVGPVITLDAMPAMMISKQRVEPAERKRMIDSIMKRQFDSATDAQWKTELRKLGAAIIVEDDRRQELIDMFLLTPTPVGKQYLLEHMKTDVSPDLDKIRSPMLAIASLNNLGAPRGVLAPDVQRLWKLQFEKAPDGARLVFFEDTGQFITEERPEELDAAVAGFLNAAADNPN